MAVLADLAVLPRLEQLLRDLRALSAVPLERFLADRGLQARAERWLQLAAQCALDWAHHVIAARGWPAPPNHRQAFEELGRRGVVSPELASQLGGWAELRDLLVRHYLEVDHRQLHRILVENSTSSRRSRSRSLVRRPGSRSRHDRNSP